MDSTYRILSGLPGRGSQGGPWEPAAYFLKATTLTIKLPRYAPPPYRSPGTIDAIALFSFVIFVHFVVASFCLSYFDCGRAGPSFFLSSKFLHVLKIRTAPVLENRICLANQGKSARAQTRKLLYIHANYSLAQMAQHLLICSRRGRSDQITGIRSKPANENISVRD